MITKYDLKYLNEYLGQYARKLVVSPEEEKNYTTTEHK